ncbi:MAG TPA: histidine phosphatase family protein [Streptosporangiaceae bacterium]|nr:histidine phosphatase family protein [Streptosporangiaceae bacterium]
MIEPAFDEIRVGDLDGKPIRAYWDWLRQHTAEDRLPHGESVDDALRRYAGALRWLLATAGTVVLVITPELALRHIAAAAAPDQPPRPDTDFANAVPYLFGEHALRHAAAGLAAPEHAPGDGRTNGARGPHLAAARLEDPFAPGK